MSKHHLLAPLLTSQCSTQPRELVGLMEFSCYAIIWMGTLQWHLKKYCKAPKRKGDGKQETTQEENVVGDVLQDALILALDNTSDYFVVDSGDSCHATPHRKFFHNYVQGFWACVIGEWWTT